MIKKIIKDRKGAADTVVVIPIILVAITLMVFFLDLASYAQKYLAVKKATDNVLRVICMQGQVSDEVPSDFPGDTEAVRDEEFWKNSEIKSYLDDVFTEAGIVSKNTSGASTPEYKAIVIFEKAFSQNSTINGTQQQKDLKDITSVQKGQYGENIRVSITYDFKWTIGGKTSTMTVTRIGGSEYKHRVEEWKGDN